MNWLQRLLLPVISFGRPAQDEALLAAQRFVVVDVETTGLDMLRDQVISIGAVTVEHALLDLAHGFEVVLQQRAPSDVDNILVHGIDGTTQTTGLDPALGLQQFIDFAGNSPLVAYHAAFDRTMIDRATKGFLGVTLRNPWIDLAYIAPALYPQLAAERHALDDWAAAFSIENVSRHNAVADASVTAQLLLVLLARAHAEGIARLTDLLQLEKDQQWLGR